MNRPGNLQIGMQRLKRATTELQEKWALTQQDWNDQTAQDFQNRYLESLLPTLRLVLAETAELEAAYRTLEATCRDDETREVR